MARLEPFFRADLVSELTKCPVLPLIDILAGHARLGGGNPAARAFIFRIDRGAARERSTGSKEETECEKLESFHNRRSYD